VVEVLEEAARAGAIYVEVRFGRETILRPDFMAIFREAVGVVQKTYEDFHAEALATLIPQAHSSELDRLVAACKEAASQGLTGVDLIPSSYDSEADWSRAYEVAEGLAALGLGITANAGEFSIANLRAVLALPGIRRIGHGIFAAFDAALLQEVQDKGVCLECCLTSNVVLGAVRSYEEHPVRRLIEAGIPVTLNTDDPVRFCTAIDREYALALRSGLTQQDLIKATANAILFSFTSPENRSRLLGIHAQSALDSTEQLQS
jgi:adenosine deaminase